LIFYLIVPDGIVFLLLFDLDLDLCDSEEADDFGFDEVLEPDELEPFEPLRLPPNLCLLKFLSNFSLSSSSFF
jgi:hypothetical protein